jgi:uncharacterized protein
LHSLHIDCVQIPLSSLGKGISEFRFQRALTDLWVGDVCRFPEVLEIRVRVTWVEGDFLVESEVVSDGVFVCDRCTTEYRKKLKGVSKTLYTADPGKIDGDSGGDVKLFNPGMEALDITQDVQDSLVLAIPFKRLCSEDCKGICPQCGVNLNERSCRCGEKEPDSRWDALKNLKFPD